MSCGKPTITTNIGSYPTAIENKKDGYSLVFFGVLRTYFGLSLECVWMTLEDLG